jgi:hypothetical protein
VINEAFLWIVEIEVPFHHTKISKWEVIIVSKMGEKLVHDRVFSSWKEAAINANRWINTHPEVRSRCIVKLSINDNENGVYDNSFINVRGECRPHISTNVDGPNAANLLADG